MPAKKPPVTKRDLDYIYIVKCKNIHGIEFKIGIESTMEGALDLKKTFSENRQFSRYWCKPKQEYPEVLIEKKKI